MVRKYSKNSACNCSNGEFVQPFSDMKQKNQSIWPRGHFGNPPLVVIHVISWTPSPHLTMWYMDAPLWPFFTLFHFLFTTTHKFNFGVRFFKIFLNLPIWKKRSCFPHPQAIIVTNLPAFQLVKWVANLLTCSSVFKKI